MKRFELDRDPRHLLVRAGDSRVLIDTGSPRSFGRPEIESIVRSSGDDLDALVGWDVLRRVRIDVDPQNFQVLLNDTATQQGATVELDDASGIPALECKVDGAPVRMFLDTGSTITYLRTTIQAGRPAAGRFEDFYPGVGRFLAELRPARVELAGASWRVDIGSSATVVDRLLGPGVDGILGLDVLRQQPFSINGPTRSLVLVAPG